MDLDYRKPFAVSVHVLLAACMFVASTCVAATTDAEPVSAERQHTWWAGPGYWDRRHAVKLGEIASGPKEYDFVFIGDSITHSWEGWCDPLDLEAVDKAYEKGMLKFRNGPGRKVWDEMKKEFRLLNLGCAGDTTQNVLWRIDHGELDGYKTRGVALMIGTNNGEPAEEIAEGIKAVVRRILEKQPAAKVVLMPIFPAEHSPSAPRRIRNARASELAKSIADGERVIWLDFNSVFLEKDGTLSAEMMPDYLHPLEHVYALWRAAIEPVMRKVLNSAEKRME